MIFSLNTSCKPLLAIYWQRRSPPQRRLLRCLALRMVALPWLLATNEAPVSLLPAVNSGDNLLKKVTET
jgi:hypothetical protein